MATADEMVATSVTVSPACGAAGVRCCNERSASLGGISNAGRWAGSSSAVAAGLAGAQRCCTAAAGVVPAAGDAGFEQKIKSSSVAVGAVDFACGSNSRVTRGDCDLLLQRRVHSWGIPKGLHHHPAAASAAVAGAETGGTGGGEGEESARVPALHHPVSGDESDTLSSKSSRDLLRSNKNDWAVGNTKVPPTEVTGTSCPDFLLFFPRSPKKNGSGTENAKKALFLAAATGATNGSDSSTCGSACVSTDDERASGYSRQDHDASKKYQRLISPATAYNAETLPAAADAAAPAAVTAGEEDDLETDSAVGLGGDGSATVAQVVLSVHVAAPTETPAAVNGATGGATLASITGGTSAADLPVPDACAAVQQSPTEEAEKLCRTSAAEPENICRCTGVGDSSDMCTPRLQAEATREVVLVPRDFTPEVAAAGTTTPAVGPTETIKATAVAGEDAARGMTEAAATAEGVVAQAADATSKHESVSTVGVEGRVKGMENTNGTAQACTKVDAAVLFPSPQPPSLPQLLQLPDVYEAAVLALRVLPERYMQRIQQLDALETLCPWVYVRCSFLARVRRIYVVSTELTLSKKEALLQQLLQERSSRQRSRTHHVKPHEKQHQEGEGRSESEQQVEEEDDEDDSCSWNGDREQHKALRAVADLFMEIKAVQTRVGPTLLAGVAQLVDALQALEQQEQKRKETSTESTGSCCTSGYDDKNDYASSGCNCSNDTYNNNGFSTTCSTFSVSNASANGVNNERERSTDRSEARKNSDSDGTSRGQDANSTTASCAGTFCIAHCCRSVQALVDNFLHSFFSCRVAAELQREHFLLAVQSGDCGAILSSCLPMEKLIFHAALDAQELALHHLGIAAPVEVWVGEAGEADEQLRAFLLAASLHEGPVAVAWSACSSPRSDATCRPEESGSAQCDVAGAATAAVGDEDAAACVQGGTRGGGLSSGSEMEAQRQQQEGWKSGTGVAEERSEAVAGGGGSSTCCSGCVGFSSFASPRWTRWGRDSHGTSAFPRNSSCNRSSSALPGTVRFPCFASYAYSGIFELLKNSMRASVEAWRLNRYARKGSSGNGSNSEVRCTGVSDAGSQRSSRSESENDEQQKWRLLSVKRSRKLKKLPGRVRLQRCCFESAASRQWGMMACSEDVAAAADQERTARSKNKENDQPWVQGQPLTRVDEGDFPAREEEACSEVFQLEDGVLEPIKVVLLFIDDSLIIRIEDHGEGLPQNELQNVWSFAYTTAPVKGLLQRLAASSEDGEEDKGDSAAAETRGAGRSASFGNLTTAVPPLAGCGVGLPMSRVHAQSLGGDIFLESAEGRGTCAYMCLSNLQGFRDRFHEQHRSRQRRNT